MNQLIYITACVSLVVQLIVALIGVYGMSLNVNSTYSILKELLFMETIVQTIEFVYYIWLIRNIKTAKYEVTFTRYFDWTFSTPLMLITSSMYLKASKDSFQNATKVLPLMYENITPLIQMLCANEVMLIFGYLGEINKLDKFISFIGGTIAFLITFFIMFIYFLGDSTIDQVLFWTMVIVWFFYGIAFLMPYNLKNSIYNILDLFSKNGFGLFLFYELYKKSL